MLNMQFSVFWLLLLTATVAIDICVGLQLSQNHVYIFYQASLKPVFYVASLLLALVWQMVALISLLPSPSHHTRHVIVFDSRDS